MGMGTGGCGLGSMLNPDPQTLGDPRRGVKFSNRKTHRTTPDLKVEDKKMSSYVISPYPNLKCVHRKYYTVDGGRESAAGPFASDNRP